MTKPRSVDITKNELDAFYQTPWEKSWLSHTNAGHYPEHERYEERMLLSTGLVDKDAQDCFTVLDVGSGVGIYAIHVAWSFPHSEVLGLDISPEQVEISNRASQRLGLGGRVRFVTGDAEDFTLNRQYDYILCTELLEHVLDPIKVLTSIRKHCHRGTRIVVEVPQYFGNNEAGIFYRQVNADGTVSDSLDSANSNDTQSVHRFYHGIFTRREMIALMAQSGFEIEVLTGCGLYLTRPVTLAKLPFMLFRKAIFQMQRLGYRISNKQIEVLINNLSTWRFARTLSLRSRVLKPCVY